MTLDDIRAYTERNWALLSELDADFWRERLAIAGPAAVVTAIDSTRRFLQEVRPGWPGDEARADDFAHHVHLAAVLRRAQL